MPHHKNEVLALDIGTRTIMGVVLEKTDGTNFRVRATEHHEHHDRVMYEGQVHDVAAVAKSVAKVKAALEQRRQTTFDCAAVAAAGRSLHMSRGQAHRRRIGLSAVTKAEIEALELEALRSAQTQLVAEQGATAAAGFFCVGYSVSHYLLDGEPISQLLGQVGSRIGGELIATFLPRVVVNALFSVLKRAGLEPASLTLEPIAALEVSVPHGMRQLNLALLDIGAGTADIALVRKNRVFAYGMVPLAGDKITDALCQEYLLDFNTAEAVKKMLSQQKEVVFTDILGNEQHLPATHLITGLQPLVMEMATGIASQVLSLNEGSPDAVLMVGGGSLTPGLPQALAEALGLPQSRVGIRSREMIDHIIGHPKTLSGPQAITPLGIAVTAFGEGPLHFIDVTVNEQPVPLWQGAGQTVADALLAAGGNWTHLFGRPGLAVTAEVNGKLQVIPGGHGHAPILLVNNKASSLDAKLKPGDRIEFTPGTNGQPARATVRDLIANSPTIIVNGEEHPYPAKIHIDGKIGGFDSPVRDRAQITIDWKRPLIEVLTALGVDPSQVKKQKIPFRLDGQQRLFTYYPCEFRLNGKAAVETDFIQPGDELEYSFKPPKPSIGFAIAEHIKLRGPFKVMVNEEEVEFPASHTKVLVNGMPARLKDLLRPDVDITIMPGQMKYIVSDLFALIDVKENARPGSRLDMIVNGQAATFTTPLNSGDEVCLVWNKQLRGGDR
jgi:cell division protein FtsA